MTGRTGSSRPVTPMAFLACKFASGRKCQPERTHTHPNVSKLVSGNGTLTLASPGLCFLPLPCLLSTVLSIHSYCSRLTILLILSNNPPCSTGPRPLLNGLLSPGSFIHLNDWAKKDTKAQGQSGPWTKAPEHKGAARNERKAPGRINGDKTWTGP